MNIDVNFDQNLKIYSIILEYKSSNEMLSFLLITCVNG